ncbi:hypothetical protein [Clostridium botulinum]|uniref:hypothetical protein n=1 Tax=Clostridium botulinum TaxID=1491 RepID=UPI000773D4A4|nr:hypothetical protein [Clostridium botulinum]MBY6811895.1 hypothetical protein [Clostridium botulinum]MBY6825377.1 hypothetical protein [Clostridium botulinum]MBY6835730.1 hypothetical protein [Clostridium botulinum]MBY6974411.1 hypothetical protein [Clostridium botulinum]MCS6105469.1 hypothetical protein [Clostridium botulinum]
MKSINYECSPVLIKGYLYYEDMMPVKNAIILLEIVLLEWEKKYIENSSSLYCAYCTTNSYGEFCFKINDKNHYYKIKIYENQNIKYSDNKLVVIDM